MEKSNSIEREAVTQLKKLIPDLLKEQTELDELLKSDLFNPDAGRYKNVQIWSNESKTILAANSEVTNLLETVAELGFRLAERLDVVKNWVALSESKITTAHDMTTTARSAMLSTLDSAIGIATSFSQIGYDYFGNRIDIGRRLTTAENVRVTPILADIENAIRFADRATIFEVRNKVFSMHSSYEIIRHLWLENKTEITNIKVEADAGY